MNRLTNAERARIVSCLVEGNSLRATAPHGGTPGAIPGGRQATEWPEP
mgnify:CR=1 FL=1